MEKSLDDDSPSLQSDLYGAVQSWISENVAGQELRSRFAEQLICSCRELEAAGATTDICNSFYKQFRAYETWQRFTENLSADLVFDQSGHRLSDEAARSDAYKEIDFVMQNAGYSISRIPGFYPLLENSSTPASPAKSDFDSDFDCISDDEIEEDTGNGDDKWLQPYRMFNEEQRTVFDTVKADLEDPIVRKKCYFLSGRAGTGKTFLYSALFHYVVSRAREADGVFEPVLCVASTGVAATLLPNGRTSHKAFGFPIGDVESLTFERRLPLLSNQLIDTLVRARLIIWDEATMNTRQQLDYVDELLRFLTANDVPFGGKVVLMGGDYHQILPVCTKPEDYLFQAEVWPEFQHFMLIQNMRSAEDVEFQNLLIKISDGGEQYFEFPSTMITQTQLSDLLFSDLIVDEEYGQMARRAILAPTNKQVDKWNELVLQMLPINTERKFFSKGLESREFHEDDESMESPSECLTLRKNALIMLTRNIDVEQGLCNGTRLRYLHLTDDFRLKCRRLTGRRAGQIVYIPQTNYWGQNQKQFPVRLAFAMTIHKSQGQTFDMVGLDLTRLYRLNHGQFYVAMSRVRKQPNVFVYDENHSSGHLGVPLHYDPSVLQLISQLSE